jgi:hypothetical protein
MGKIIERALSVFRWLFAEPQLDPATGTHAFRAGKGLDGNPHPRGTPDHDKWAGEWLDAEAMWAIK